jgi:hypothetical protein
MLDFLHMLPTITPTGSSMFRTDLKPGETLQVGKARITLESKSGNLVRLAVSADRPIAIFKVSPCQPPKTKMG